MNILEKWLDDLNSKIKQAKTSMPTFLKIGVLLRPEILRPMYTAQDFFAQMIENSYTLPNGTKVIIDPGLKYSLEIINNLPGWKDIPRKYDVKKTLTEGITDYQIISNNLIKEYNSLEEIFATAAFLIFEDMEDRGVLYNLSMDNDQENINLGYYLDDYGWIKMVFLERKRPVVGQPREYHIHESMTPREYKKKNRYFLTPHKA